MFLTLAGRFSGRISNLLTDSQQSFPTQTAHKQRINVPQKVAHGPLATACYSKICECIIATVAAARALVVIIDARRLVIQIVAIHNRIQKLAITEYIM